MLGQKGNSLQNRRFQTRNGLRKQVLYVKGAYESRLLKTSQCWNFLPE